MRLQEWPCPLGAEDTERLDGVDGVRLGSWSLGHQARPGEVELLHKVQAGVQAQCRVLHKTDLVSPVQGLLTTTTVPASPETEVSRHKNKCPNSRAGDLIWPLTAHMLLHKGLHSDRQDKTHNMTNKGMV